MTSSNEQSEANEKEDYVTTAELLQVLEERDSALAELEGAKLSNGILLLTVITIACVIIVLLALYIRHIKRNLARVPPDAFKVGDVQQVNKV